MVDIQIDLQENTITIMDMVHINTLMEFVLMITMIKQTILVVVHQAVNQVHLQLLKHLLK